MTFSGRLTQYGHSGVQKLRTRAAGEAIPDTRPVQLKGVVTRIARAEPSPDGPSKRKPGE